MLSPTSVLTCDFSNPLFLYLKTIVFNLISIHCNLKGFSVYTSCQKHSGVSQNAHSPRPSDLRFYLVTSSMIHNYSYPFSIERCCVEDFNSARRKKKKALTNLRTVTSEPRKAVNICFNESFDGLGFLYHMLL